MTTIRDIALPDGRRIDVVIGGAGHGPALVLHHGTPSDATVWLDWDDVAREHGLQLIAVSRPGYATSTRHAHRRVVDAVADIEAVLAQRDVPWFVTAGWSGGGPHALATAARSAGRCRAAATLAGVGPYGEPELDFCAGMGPENVAEFSAASAGEAVLRTWLLENGSAFRTIDGAQLITAFGGLVADVDRDVLTGGFADRFAAELRRSLEAGLDGWIDDDLAFTKPWGFALAAVEIPVTVWQGDLDLMVPIAHGRLLANRIPNATFRSASGHGHLSLVRAHKDAIVRDLLAGASADASRARLG